ncbi:MAG: Lrp/AsnC family transcriptional regulator [Fervidicoccaceae archaeon]
MPDRGAVEVDELDLALIEALRRNARASLREIARQIGRSPSVVLSRLRRLESEGVIRGYTALIDYKKIGYDVCALTLLQVDGAHIAEVERALASEPNVRIVFDVTGEYDVAAISVFKSVSELDSFIKRTLGNPHVRRSVTNLVLRVVKDEPHVSRPLVERERSGRGA